MATTAVENPRPLAPAQRMPHTHAVSAISSIRQRHRDTAALSRRQYHEHLLPAQRHGHVGTAVAVEDGEEVQQGRAAAGLQEEARPHEDGVLHVPQRAGPEIDAIAGAAIASSGEAVEGEEDDAEDG